MATALRCASRSLNTPSKFASIKLLMVSVMVNPPSIHFEPILDVYLIELGYRICRQMNVFQRCRGHRLIVCHV